MVNLGEKVVEEDVEAVISVWTRTATALSTTPVHEVILAQKSSNGQGAAGTDIDY